MVDGQIDESASTITVQLSNGANLYASVKFNTSIPGLVSVGADNIYTEDSIHFSDDLGNNNPMKFQLSSIGFPTRNYVIKVTATSMSECNCTPANGSTCACPYIPNHLLTLGDTFTWNLKCTNPSYIYFKDWNWRQSGSGALCFFNGHYDNNYEGITCTNANIFGGDNNIQMQVVCTNTAPAQKAN